MKEITTGCIAVKRQKNICQHFSHLKEMYEIQQERQKLNNKDNTISHIRLNFNNNHQKVNHESKLLKVNEVGGANFGIRYTI